MKKQKQKRIVVITGATSGIGEATAEAFNAAGDTVIGIARNEGGGAGLNRFFAGDVSDEKAMEKIFAAIGKEYGRVDVLVNNAGYGLSGATELLSVEAARKIFDVNVIGKFIISKFALPLMPRCAKLFYIRSSMAVHPVPFRALYGASKAAVRNMALAQRMECRDFGVDVCCICPGDIKTNFTAARVKDFTTNERYGGRMARAAGDLDTKEGKRMPPDAVAKVIFKQAAKRRTKPQVIVGGKHKLLHFLTRIFPLSLYLSAAEKATGGGSVSD
jgi:NAD(P)-dependent dehydrogenase (short-subunit alcohol dehydrogenase family)